MTTLGKRSGRISVRHEPGGERSRGRSSERGSAIVDFVLVAVVLVPLFFGILQLALIWHVKSTLTAAASEGAHFGATYRHTPAQGAARTRAVIARTFGAGFQDAVSAHATRIDGQPGVQVDVTARVPVLVFWGPWLSVSVSGHAVAEGLP